MDPMVVAGSALAGAGATDAWQQARAGLVRLWRRVRPAEAGAVGEEELSGVRTPSYDTSRWYLSLGDQHVHR
ncbi:hypothetical protein [Streptomyces sp. MH13]|uniref:hypothetical protein n=1 Tax=unclassified Streptomyces TaxID=2593676 RepID=UPI003CF4609C